MQFLSDPAKQASCPSETRTAGGHMTYDLYYQMQLVGIVQHRSLVNLVKPLDLPVGIKAIRVANVVKIVRILKAIG